MQRAIVNIKPRNPASVTAVGLKQKVGNPLSCFPALLRSKLRGSTADCTPHYDIGTPLRVMVTPSVFDRLFALCYKR